MKRRTTYATSNYTGGMRAASVSSGGVVGRGGKFISRRQRYRDMRLAFGMSGG